MAKKTKKPKGGGAGIFIIAVVILILLGFIVHKTNNLKITLAAKQQQLDYINSQIDAAKEKTDDIENELKYRETDDYIEDEARGLGLRYPNEVILVPKEE